MNDNCISRCLDIWMDGYMCKQMNGYWNGLNFSMNDINAWMRGWVPLWMHVCLYMYV